jgi:hypothetical protein
MKRLNYILVLALIVPSLVHGQKIKYSDVFLKLNSKNYDEGAPLLRQFLADPKVSNHPNGTYFMGVILEDKFVKQDILSDTLKTYALADSSVAFYKSSLKLIDEKEIKKNSDLYQSFYRRDLRTGEFGIKISDVHLDIEKKIDAIEKRKSSLKNLHTTLRKINGKYAVSSKLYKEFSDKEKNYRELLLGMSDKDLTTLDGILANSTGLNALASTLKTIATELGTDKYQQDLKLKPVNQYAIEGIAQENIYSGQLSLWDYEGWATRVKAEYAGLNDFRKKLVDTESKISEANKAMASGQVPPTITLTHLQADAEKYDPRSTPMELLDLKINQLEVQQMTSRSLHPMLADTTNIIVQLELAEDVVEKLDKMKGIHTALSPDRIYKAKMQYASVINAAYGSETGLDDFLRSVGGWLSPTEKQWKARYERFSEREKWAISGKDSVAMFVRKKGAKTTWGVRGAEAKTAYGYDKKTKKGYVAWTGAERTIEHIKNFEIGKMNHTNVQVMEFEVPHLIFCAFDESLTTDKNLAIVSAVDGGALKWANLIKATRMPVTSRYDATLDQITIFFFPPDQLPESSDELTYVVIDRHGTVR